MANVLEGAVRKWVPGFGGGAGRLLAYFSKDLLFTLGAMLIVSRPVRLRPSRDVFSGWMGAAWALMGVGAALSAAQAFNMVGTGLTLRALVFLPLLALMFVRRISGFPLLAVASVTVIFALVNLPLSLAQSRLPSGHILNKYASDMGYIVEVDAGVRATGTFAYITGLGVMSAAGTWAGLVVLSLGRGWKYQVLGVAGLIASLGCGFASVSRGPVVVALAMIGMWALSSAKTVKLIWKAAWYGAAVSLVALLFAPGLSDRFLHMGEGAFDRFSSAGDSNMGRAVGQFEEMWQAITEHPMGVGLGTEQVGGNVAATGVAGFTNYESQFPRVVAELGVAGLLGFFLLVGGTVLALQKAKQDYSAAGFPLAMTATQLFFLSQSYTSLMVNHTASAFAWLTVAGALAAVPASKRSEAVRTDGRRRMRKGRRVDSEALEAVRNKPALDGIPE